MSTAGERCELALGVAAGGTGRYWAMLHNRDASAQTGRLSRYEVPLLATDGSLVTTAPGVLAAGESFPLRVQWDDPTLLNGESRVGYVQMRLGGSTQALFPVKLTRNANDNSPLALISGVDRSMRLAGNGSHEQLFIDVPAGATQLVVTTSSTANVDVYLARVAPPVASSAVPSVAMAPARHLAQSSATTASGNETVTVALPAVGRWYVTPVNTTPAAVTLTVRATVTASAPTVRPGGYYNTGRAGHGVFLYPAGSDWVGLWFTYLPDRTPTWYYRQGPAPGSNGLWRGEVYRATWVGGGRFLTAVGEATATSSLRGSMMPRPAMRPSSRVLRAGRLGGAVTALLGVSSQVTATAKPRLRAARRGSRRLIMGWTPERRRSARPRAPRPGPRGRRPSRRCGRRS